MDSGFQPFPWNLDSGLLGLYSGFQSPGFQFPQANFSRIPEFPDSLTWSDYSVWPAKAKVLRGILLKIKQERSSRHRMKSERLVQTDELGGEGHNAKKTWSLLLALAPTDNCKLRFLSLGPGSLVGEKLGVKQHKSASEASQEEDQVKQSLSEVDTLSV